MVSDNYGDERNMILIAKTLLKLPEEVRERVVTEARFVVMCESDGALTNLRLSGVLPEIREKVDSMEEDATIKVSTLEKMEFNPPLIVLNFKAMRKKSDSYKMNMIAHEIAHFILGDFGETSNLKAEREADGLMKRGGPRRTIHTPTSRFLPPRRSVPYRCRPNRFYS